MYLHILQIEWLTCECDLLSFVGRVDVCRLMSVDGWDEIWSGTPDCFLVRCEGNSVVVDQSLGPRSAMDVSIHFEDQRGDKVRHVRDWVHMN